MSHSAAKRKLRSSYATTIISISLVLFLLGIIGFLYLNANRLSVYVKENLGFTVLINDNAREAEVIRLQKVLNAAPYVRMADRKSTRLNSSHVRISYAVFCLKKK